MHSHTAMVYMHSPAGQVCPCFATQYHYLWVKIWLPAEQNSDVKPLDYELKYDCQAQSTRKFKTAISGQ
jgi:hypothetical protein